MADNWKQTIWREWRHCVDPDYAERLYALVADEPVGWGAKLSAILFNMIGGAAIAVVCGAVITFDWSVLQHFAWAGAIIGGVRGYRYSRQLSWRSWLERLSANTPTGSFSRALFGTLCLALLGGMIFGPVFWLLASGLFWVIGEVINWINRGLTATSQGSLENRRWWFWWSRRPYLFYVESALLQATAASPEADRDWNTPFRRLGLPESFPSLPDTLVASMLSKDWAERFVARHRLVRLGEEAIPALLTVGQQHDSPLQQTALWLLRNIAHPSSGMLPVDVRPVEQVAASREDY